MWWEENDTVTYNVVGRERHIDTQCGGKMTTHRHTMWWEENSTVTHNVVGRERHNDTQCGGKRMTQ